jgi:hypothetical protein
MHWSRIAVLAASCVLLWGCTEAPRPSTPPPSPVAPAPTFSCTPEAGGAAYECSQFDYEQMVAKDKLYAEAEAVYRKFFAEDERIYRAGGVDEPTPVLLETTTGAFLEGAMNLYRALRRNKARAVEGASVLRSVTPQPQLTREGSVATLLACVDATSVLLRGDAGYENRGLLMLQRLYLSQGSGGLKLQSSQWKEVKSCD